MITKFFVITTVQNIREMMLFFKVIVDFVQGIS